MSSSSKKNVKLSVDNKLLGAVDNFDRQQPSSASTNTLVTATSTFSAAETPRNQYIMPPNEREAQAKKFVTEIGLKWDELNDCQKTRAKKLMSPDYAWSPNRGKTPSAAETPRNQYILPPHEREAQAEKFVTELGLQWVELNDCQKTRAKNIMSPDYAWSPNRGNASSNKTYIGTTFKEEWDKFVGGLEGELKDAFFDNYENVFFDEKALTKYMVIHRQLSGICSSHAIAIAQHYIASKRRGDDGDEQSVDHHTMLDISSYIRYKLPKDTQISYILEGVTGLNSFELLKNFTGTNELDYAQYYLTGGDEFDMRNLYEKFHRHLEPTLVGHFRFCPAQFSKKSSVLDGFMDQSEYDGLAQNNGKASVHAMVLIGAYQSKDKRYWFLLQNSHEGNYFKLISGEYLASCCPKIYFASPNADMELEEGYPVAAGEYSETAAVLEECAWQYPEGEG